MMASTTSLVDGSMAMLTENVNGSDGATIRRQNQGHGASYHQTGPSHLF